MILSNIDIVLLSAGVGRRLGRLGKVIPKSLVEINGETLISRLIKILKKNGAKSISILVGYKSDLLKNELKKFKQIKFKFIKIKGFKKYGHAFTWYSYKKFWQKNKKKILLMHTDIIFDEKILTNILKSKKENIIGMKDKMGHKMGQNSFVIRTNSKNEIKEINFLKFLNNFSGEIIGINKISSQLMGKIFEFMDFEFKNSRNKYLSWEQIINKFIIKQKPKIYSLTNQKYNWININKISDLKKANRAFNTL
tara:strand:+ start:2874 stop:3629 length:756 start_codon:yes stop_codon:yes gene_type:complete